MEIPIENLKNLLKKNLLILCHHNADPDSICAAYAFQEMSKKICASKKSDIFLPGGASKLSEKVIEDFAICTVEKPSMKVFGTIVVLDTATMNQLEGWGKIVASSKAQKILIDHHFPHPETSPLFAIRMIDQNASSTCEIIHRIYKAFKIMPSAEASKAMLLGILFDSRNFTYGKPSTFRAVAELMDSGASLEEVIHLLKYDMGRPERIARLKAAQRMQFKEIGGWLIATSHIGSFQASSARSILRLGADAVIVVSREKGRLKASLRSSSEFHKLSQVHLGKDVAIPLGAEFNGAGSGHPTAAGVNCEGRTKIFLQRTVEILKDKVTSRA